MLKARYYQTDGAKGGEQDLPEWLFDGVVNEDVLHQVIKAYLSNQRQGTASAKSRGQVRGGGAKPWKQKGTGRARQGTIRAVQWAGGGVAFPPIPHSWRQRVPKKVRALARRSAFNARAQGERVVLIDAIDFEAPKTKQLLGLLSAIGAEGKILVLTDGSKDNVHLSARNLPNVETRPFGQESAYDILWASVVVIEKTALDSAEPSEADREATSSRGRGEPEVRGRERDAIAEQAERRKAHRGHSKTAKLAAPKAEAAEKKAAQPKPEKPAEPEATPEVAEAPAADGGSDVGSVKPPKIAELADFLAQIDSAATVKALQASDARKTAQAHYDARLTELEGGNEAQEGDDA
jgi:large subunit ribosomal protein L4